MNLVMKKFFSTQKNLFVFDFDETIIQHNSDTYFYKIFPDSNIPKSLKETYKQGYWLDFMRNVFDHLKKNNISPMRIKQVLEEIPLTHGFKELLEYLNSNKEKVDSIIISNANTLFVDWILQKHGFKMVFDGIFTNPATITDDKIQILNYHSHECKLCALTSVNLCKKTVLLKYLMGKQYKKLYYAGDGYNDFCPTTIMKKEDLVFSRKNYPLSDALKQNKKKNEYEATIIYWTDGFDILKEIQK